jgi:hypothetical protein
MAVAGGGDALQHGWTPRTTDDQSDGGTNH